MSTEQERTPEQERGGESDADGVAADEQQPNWWHRDHPTFIALVGFFTGLGFFILGPGLFIAILKLVVDDDTAESLFPFVLVALAVPIALVLVPRTRRFGLYMLLGTIVTAVVVVGVAALVLWYMVNYQS